MNNKKWWESPLYSGIFSPSKTTTVESTGAGEDGQIQPNNPVGMIPTDQGPKMLHEGELKITDQNGNFSVIPSSQLPQSLLRQIERESKMGGFATGGTGTQSNWLGNVKGVLGINKSSESGPVVNNVNKVTQNAPTPTYNMAPTEQRTIQNINPISPTGSQSIQSTLPNPVTPSAPTPEYNIAPKVQPVAPTTPEPSQATQDQQLATDVIRGYATGKSPYAQSILNTQLTDVGATGAAAQGALKQNLAMAGAGEDATQTALAVNQRDLESSEAKLRAGIAQSAMQEQLGAAGTLSNIATNAENTAYQRAWNENDRDYQRAKAENQTNYERNIAAATTAFNAGDFDGAAKLFQTAIPNANIDFSKLKTQAQQKAFTDAMGNIQTWAATSNMTWDELEPILDKSGVFKDTGIDKAQAKNIVQDIRNMTNPVTAAAATFSDNNIQTLFPTLDKNQYSGLRNELVQLALFGGTSKDGTMDTTKINTTSMPILAKLMGVEEKPTTKEGKEAGSFAGYKLATYDKKNDVYTYEDFDGNMVQFTGAEVSGNPNLSEAAKEKGAAPETEWADKGLSFGTDQDNIDASFGDKFDQAGRIHKKGGQWSPLGNGVKITLSQPFGVEGASTSIPAGNYTTVKVKDSTYGAELTLLKSEDGNKYYLNSSRIQAPNGVYVTWRPPIKGYIYNEDGGYYTKELSAKEAAVSKLKQMGVTQEQIDKYLNEKGA